MSIQVVTVQLPGSPGPAGPPNNLTIGAITTLPAGSNASASLVGFPPSQILNLSLPQGNDGPAGPAGVQGPQGAVGPAGANGKDGAGIQVAGQVAAYANLPSNLTSADAGKAYIVSADGKLYIWSGTAFPASGAGNTFVGPSGPANTLTIGTVTTGVVGATAVATITGTAPNQTLNLTLPRGATGNTGNTGATGPANTLSIGTVTTGIAGSAATASITGTAPSQTLNLSIPKGDAGGAGPMGPAGPAGANGVGVPTGGLEGQVLTKISGSDYDTSWVTASSGSLNSVGYADLPAGSTIVVQKNGAIWPARPTTRTDIFVWWKGADPSPAIVSTGTGGMLNNIDMRLVTS